MFWGERAEGRGCNALGGGKERERKSERMDEANVAEVGESGLWRRMNHLLFLI